MNKKYTLKNTEFFFLGFYMFFELLNCKKKILYFPIKTRINDSFFSGFDIGELVNKIEKSIFPLK